MHYTHLPSVILVSTIKASHTCRSTTKENTTALKSLVNSAQFNHVYPRCPSPAQSPVTKLQTIALILKQQPPAQVCWWEVNSCFLLLTDFMKLWKDLRINWSEKVCLLTGCVSFAWKLALELRIVRNRTNWLTDLGWSRGRGLADISLCATSLSSSLGLAVNQTAGFWEL